MIYLLVYEDKRIVQVYDSTGFENSNINNILIDSPMPRLPLLNTIMRYKKPNVVAVETTLPIDEVRTLSYDDAIQYGETIL